MILTFNLILDVYLAFETASISATLNNPFKIDEFRGLPKYLGFTPNIIDGYDIKVDVFTFT